MNSLNQTVNSSGTKKMCFGSDYFLFDIEIFFFFMLPCLALKTKNTKEKFKQHFQYNNFKVGPGSELLSRIRIFGKIFGSGESGSATQ